MILQSMKKNEKEEANLDMDSSNWQFVFVVFKMFYLNMKKTKKNTQQSFKWEWIGRGCMWEHQIFANMLLYASDLVCNMTIFCKS